MSSSDALNADRLGAINKKLLGKEGSTEFPTVTLASGDKIRTGTIATLLHNLRLYDKSTDNVEKKTLEDEIRLAIPVLNKVGMFELFTPQEWASDSTKSEGRKLVGRLAIEEGL